MKILFPCFLLIVLITGCCEQAKKKKGPKNNIVNNPSIDSLSSANKSSLTDF